MSFFSLFLKLIVCSVELWFPGNALVCRDLPAQSRPIRDVDSGSHSVEQLSNHHGGHDSFGFVIQTVVDFWVIVQTSEPPRLSRVPSDWPLVDPSSRDILLREVGSIPSLSENTWLAVYMCCLVDGYTILYCIIIFSPGWICTSASRLASASM